MFPVAHGGDSGASKNTASIDALDPPPLVADVADEVPVIAAFAAIVPADVAARYCHVDGHVDADERQKGLLIFRRDEGTTCHMRTGGGGRTEGWWVGDGV